MGGSFPEEEEEVQIPIEQNSMKDFFEQVIVEFFKLYVLHLSVYMHFSIHYCNVVLDM